jgi:hypothetical protein
MVKVSINNVQLKQETLKERLEIEIAETRKVIDKQNRQVRRSRQMKWLAGLFGVVSSIALLCPDYATAADPSMANETIDPHKGIGSGVMDKIADGVAKRLTPEFLRDDTMLWRLNEYMSKTLLHTHDIFSNPSIMGLYTTIATITLSCLTIIIGKKGYDMITSKLLGTTTIGLPDLIIRLLCSVVIGFLSLKIAGLGILASNLIVDVFFKNVATGVLPESSMGGYFGAMIWTVGYILMFAILMVRYWVRQISIVILGLMTPVATISWVTDGGAMLKTLIKEFIVCLTTPMTQGLILVIGSIMLTEVAPAIAGDGMLGFFNQLFIGLSTLFLMIISPEFLRKFIHGDANPLKWAAKTAVGVKTLPLRMMNFIKK